MSRVRLGTGDFVPAGASNPYARMRYLLAVHRVVPEAYRELVALEPSNEAQLHAWAELWGFTDAWGLDFARHHAPLWRENPEVIGRAAIVSVVSWEPVFPPGPTFKMNETEATLDARWADYKARMKAAPAMQPTPYKADDRHFEWTALYHVAGFKQPQIAELYQEKYPEEYDGLTPGTVSGAIKTVAQLTGLTLRRKQGRPKTSDRASSR